jgi:dipeptidyl aminopeptidase/acylaminoacyl peptidase
VRKTFAKLHIECAKASSLCLQGWIENYNHSTLEQLLTMKINKMSGRVILQNQKVVLLVILIVWVKQLSSQFPNYYGELNPSSKYIGVFRLSSQFSNKKTLLLQRVGNNQVVTFEGVNDFRFSGVGDKCIFLRNDSLYIYDLPSQKSESIANVVHFEISKISNWILMRLKNAGNLLVARNIKSGKVESIDDVNTFKICSNSGSVLMIRNLRGVNEVAVWNLEENHLITIHKSKAEIVHPVFNGNGKAILFSAHGNSGDTLCINSGTEYRSQMQIHTPKSLGKNFKISDSKVLGEKSFRFTPDGTKIIFHVQNISRPLKTIDPENQHVNVWTYFDPMFQSQQEECNQSVSNYAVVMDLLTGNLLAIEDENNSVLICDGKAQISNNYALICHYDNNTLKNELGFKYTAEGYMAYEFNWNKSLRPDIYLMSLSDGSKKLLTPQVRLTEAKDPYYKLMNNENYVVYYDGFSRNYFSYSIKSGIINNLTKDVPTSWHRSDVASYDIRYYWGPVGIYKTSSDNSSIYVWDSNRDIWKINLQAAKASQCITNKIAKINKFVFYPLGNIYELESKLKGSEDVFFLKATYPVTSGRCYNQSGIYLYTSGKQNYSLQCLVPVNGEYQYQIFSALPGKQYLISRENAKTPRASFLTIDFKAFTKVTDSEVECKKNNVMHKELITWKNESGKVSHGVLYKPKDFDSSKSYPMIVTYYEGFAGENRIFNSFTTYDRNGNYNEMLVSNSYNYLQFAVDIIHTGPGQTCEEVTSTVISGVKSIATRSYVNQSKIGVIGASFGGYSTNCLITRSGNLFAAAVSTCSYSDVVSSYLGNDFERHGEGSVEVGQNRIGVTLWARPDIFIKNSPIFYADRISTPLLLFHCKDDRNVPYPQSVEFFKALRRSGKQVWMVASDVGGHAGPLPYHTQHFFDYFLRDIPPKKWMTEGVPARFKGIDDGFATDSSGKGLPKSLLYENDLRTPLQDKLYKNKTHLTYDGLIIGDK